MALTCPRCGSQNADHSKFCLSCGNDLRPLAAPPAGGGFAPPQGGYAPPQQPGGFGAPPGPPGGPGGFGAPPQSPLGGFGAPPPREHGGFGPPPVPNPFGPPGGSQQYPPDRSDRGDRGGDRGSGYAGQQPPVLPPQPNYGAQARPPGQSGATPGIGDIASYIEGLRSIATELRGIAASKTILSSQVLASPLPGVAAVAIRYGRSMHVLCAGGPFATPIWPSRDFSDRDRLLAATLGARPTAEQLIPWVLTYVLPGVFPDLGRDPASQQAFLEAADAFGVGIDSLGVDAARRQGFPEIGPNQARFLVVSEPKQSIAGIELRWGDRPFEMLYVPTPGVVARAAPWT